MNGEHVRDNVPRAQILENVANGHRLRSLGPALADMNQQRNLQLIAELARALQWLQSLRAECAARRHDLDTNDNIPIGFNGLRDLRLVNQARIGQDTVARP